MNVESKISQLFDSGVPIRASKLLEVYAAESEATTTLDTAFEAKRLAKYKVDKLAYEQTQTTPAIDIKPVTPSIHERNRQSALENKWKLKGLSYRCETNNGGHVRIEKNAERVNQSQLKYAYATTFQGKPIKLEWEWS